MPRRSDNGTHGLRHAGDDAFQLTVDYLKQETLDPLRGLGRYLSMGIGGAFFLAFGILMILIGILRLLQTETGTALTGNWSWVPYAAVLVLGLIVIAVAVWRITAGPAQERTPAVAARQAKQAAELEQAEQAAEAVVAEPRLVSRATSATQAPPPDDVTQATPVVRDETSSDPTQEGTS